MCEHVCMYICGMCVNEYELMCVCVQVFEHVCMYV